MLRAITLASVLAATSVGSAAADDELFDVVRDGYVLLHEESYLSFEGCEYDQAYAVGPYVFICASYGYSYSYGNVILMVRRETSQLPAQGYLCTDDGDCYRGRIIHSN